MEFKDNIKNQNRKFKDSITNTYRKYLKTFFNTEIRQINESSQADSRCRKSYGKFREKLGWE